MDEQRLARLQGASLEHVGPDGHRRLDQPGRLHHRQALGDRQRLAGIDDAIFGIAAAADEPADLVADPPAGDALADARDLARDFQPRRIGGAGGRRIFADALDEIAAVEPGGMDLHQHLARLRLRHGQAADLQHVGVAELADADRVHLGGEAAHAWPSCGKLPTNLCSVRPEPSTNATDVPPQTKISWPVQKRAPSEVK